MSGTYAPPAKGTLTSQSCATLVRLVNGRGVPCSRKPAVTLVYQGVSGYYGKGDERDVCRQHAKVWRRGGWRIKPGSAR